MASRDKGPVIEEMKKQTRPLSPEARDFIKDPYVLEFLAIPDAHAFRECELEQAIIDKLQSFLLELGKGFAFVARQQRISTETKDFYVMFIFELTPESWLLNASFRSKNSNSHLLLSKKLFRIYPPFPLDMKCKNSRWLLHPHNR